MSSHEEEHRPLRSYVRSFSFIRLVTIPEIALASLSLYSKILLVFLPAFSFSLITIKFHLLPDLSLLFSDH